MAAPSEEDDVDNNTIDFLNREFGDDIRSLRNVENIYKNLCCLKEDLENKVKFFIVDKKKPSLVNFVCVPSLSS